jgi:hypothetical protein
LDVAVDLLDIAPVRHWGDRSLASGDAQDNG